MYLLTSAIGGYENTETDVPEVHIYVWKLVRTMEKISCSVHGKGEYVFTTYLWSFTELAWDPSNRKYKSTQLLFLCVSR